MEDRGVRRLGVPRGAEKSGTGTNFRGEGGWVSGELVERKFEPVPIFPGGRRGLRGTEKSGPIFPGEPAATAGRPGHKKRPVGVAGRPHQAHLMGGGAIRGGIG